MAILPRHRTVAGSLSLLAINFYADQGLRTPDVSYYDIPTDTWTRIGVSLGLLPEPITTVCSEPSRLALFSNRMPTRQETTTLVLFLKTQSTAPVVVLYSFGGVQLSYPVPHQRLSKSLLQSPHR